MVPKFYVSLPILKCGVDLEIIGDLELTLRSSYVKIYSFIEFVLQRSQTQQRAV